MRRNEMSLASADADPFVEHALEQAHDAIGQARSDPENPNKLAIAIASIFGVICAGGGASALVLYAVLAAEL